MTTRLVVGNRVVTIDGAKGISNVVVCIANVGGQALPDGSCLTLVLSDLHAFQMAKALLVESCEGAHEVKYKSGRKPKREA